ncbi:MAG: hypothetical protein ACTSSN_13605 [Candidatus Heimdallarchaeaceae archaeon]
MSDRIDIAKHLVYSAWLLTIIQMLRVASNLLFAEYSLAIVVIIDAAFDFTLILFSIGLIRLGKSLRKIEKWKLASILLITSAVIEIVGIILSYVSTKDGWNTKPFIYFNLVFLIIYYLVITVGFIFLKFTLDSLHKNDYIPRKGQWYIPLGMVILLAPSIINWYNVLIYPSALDLWILNLSLSFFLLAAFLIILGFFGLASITNMIQVGGYIVEDQNGEQENAIETEKTVEQESKMEGE